METVPPTPADSDTRTTTVRDSMILPSRGTTGGFLGWSSYEDTMVQSIMVLVRSSFFCHQMVHFATVVSLKFMVQ